ncbi:MAG TPA: fused MFS/spermidine synthase [Candidatus Limnocylindrales bacterium]|nr:fused MFS/spermidine synthase [Candidatus Limnocylindrales bacterium]
MLVRTLLLLVIFFLSGAAGLVYEVLWTRQLSLIFGVTTYAVSTVLAAFMGGLALGSYLMGRKVDAVRRPLYLYAMLELGIGLYALVAPELLAALRPLHIAISHLGLSYTVFSLIRALLAAMVFLLPTALMGGTFTLLVKHWVNERRDLAEGAGILYLVNTAGALAGCGLCGFFLIEHLGITGTNRLAAATNVMLAIAAAALARSAPEATKPIHETANPAPALRLSDATAGLVLLSAGLAGFVSLAAEVLWTRALLRYLYNSTYAFTAMLVTFLLGIALGSAAYAAFLSRSRRPLWMLAAFQAGLGLSLAAAVLMFPRLGDLGSWLFGTDIVTSFARSLTTMFVRAAIVLLPPAIFLGALFPLGATLYASGRRDVGQAIGRLYAVNTLGAILGSIGCAFVLIPVFGMWGTHKLLVLLSLSCAGALAVAAIEGTTRRAGVAVATAALVATALLAAPADIFRSTFLPYKAQKLVFYEEGATDTVGVAESFGQRAIVYEDQRGTAATSSYGVNLFLGHLPMLLHPGTPRRVLHICFGVGNSLSAVASHQELERVDNVELSPHVLEAGPLFWSNDNVLQKPKVRTIIDDGRNYLMTTSEVYDVILLEPPETFTAGVINLYTTEFYRDALAHLAPDGIIMQWIPTANAPLDDERRLFRAFSDEIPHVSMWWLLRSGCALLIGGREPLRIDYQRLKQRFAEPRVAQDMALSQVRDVDHLLSFFRFDEAAFADFVRGAAPTTDDRTVLDFSMPRYGGSGFGLGQFNIKVLDNGRNPFGFVMQREQEYRALARPVTPYLTNLGGESPEAIAARIAERAKIPIEPRRFSESDWKKIRTGELVLPNPSAPTS